MLSKPIRPQEQYYHEFSKYVLKESQNKKSKMNEENYKNITWTDYFLSNREKPSIELLKLKLPNLKFIAKSNKLHVSGNKQELVERIIGFFNKHVKAMKIQSVFRRHIVRQYFTLHGPIWLKNREKCVNETDFTTLDPLNEIPNERFFSYQDKSGFIYGFDIISLMNVFRRSNKMLNPYTREEIEYNHTKNVFTLFKILKLLWPNTVEEFDVSIVQTPVVNHTRLRDLAVQRQMQAEQKLRELREKPMLQRIQEIFMYLDELGNYTNAQWFLSLSKTDLSLFYFNFATWWTFRSRIVPSVRRAICYLENPFNEMEELSDFRAITFERYQDACVRLIENMIHTGVDLEHKRLGALHVLIIMTTVSHAARAALPWLYDTIHANM